MTDELRLIPGFVHYSVTNDGRVWTTLKRGGPCWLKPDILRQGHRRVTLIADGKGKGYLVHRLVALAWIGPVPFEGAKVLHKNDIPSDNRVENLYYGTQLDNAKDARKNGKWVKELHTRNNFKIFKGQANGNSRTNRERKRADG